MKTDSEDIVCRPLARVSASRSSHDMMNIDVLWCGHRLKLEMTLADFTMFVTGRAHTPALIDKWAPSE